MSRVAAGGLPQPRLRSVVAAASEWLVEPAQPGRQAPGLASPGSRPVVAVFGLARGCGATVVARALAAQLAARDPAGAAAVSCDRASAGVPLASRPAAQLARVLSDVPGAATRAVGRLCLVGGADPLTLADTARHHAPLVLDAGSAAVGGVPAALADHVVLVSLPRLEPALAAVVAEGLGRVGREPLLVVNRCDEDAVGPWEQRAALTLPDARMGAQLALGGREPRGGLGRALDALADRCQFAR